MFVQSSSLVLSKSSDSDGETKQPICNHSMGYRSNIKAPTYSYLLYDLKNTKKLYCPELLLAVHKCHHCVLLNIHCFENTNRHMPRIRAVTLICYYVWVLCHWYTWFTAVVRQRQKLILPPDATSRWFSPGTAVGSEAIPGVPPCLLLQPALASLF